MFRLTRFSKGMAAALLLTAWVAPAGPVETRIQEAALSANGRHDAALAEVLARPAADRASGLLGLQVTGQPGAFSATLRHTGDLLSDMRFQDEGRVIEVRFHDAVAVYPPLETVPRDPSLVRRVSSEVTGVDPRFTTVVRLELAVPCAARTDVAGGFAEIHLAPLGCAFQSPPVPAHARVLALQELDYLSRQPLVERSALAEATMRDWDGLAARADGGLPATLANAFRDGKSGMMREADTLATASQRHLASLCAGAPKADPQTLDSLVESARTEVAGLRERFTGLATRRGTLRDEVLARLDSGDADSGSERVLALAPGDSESEPIALLSNAQAVNPAWEVAMDGTRMIAAGNADGAVRPAVFQTVDAARLDFIFSAPRELAAPLLEPLMLAQTDADTSVPAPMIEAAPASAPEPDPEVAPLPEAPPAPAQVIAQSLPPKREARPAVVGGDPLFQLVTIDFREMQLKNVVQLLAQKAGINVIAGPEVSMAAPVSAYLANVPLLTAMETVLRLNSLGMIEEEGIFRIVPFDEALQQNRVSRMVHLQSARSKDVEITLTAVSSGMPEGNQITVAANESTNVLVIAGPEKRVTELEELAIKLDMAEPSMNTATEAIKLNYLLPSDLATLIKPMMTPDVGSVEADEQGRHIIMTDQPIVIEQVRALIAQMDKPVKQVAIEALVVDAVLRDSAQTGVSWLLDLVRERDPFNNDPVRLLDSRRNTRGQLIGSLDSGTAMANLGNIGSQGLDAGMLTFGVLTGSFNLRSTIAAEAASANAEILANPVVVTVENKQADIQIVQDFPYQQITQSTQGPPVSSTEFKEIGIQLTVTPRVTHENDILVELNTKQSSISGLTGDGIPIEDKRVADTTLRMKNGRTIFIGGLRNINDRTDVSKIPVLGDVPIINFMFRTTDKEKIHTELLIFLTCNVIEDVLPELTPDQQVKFDKIDDVPDVPDAQRSLFRSVVRPGEMRDPAWKWRRTP
jgi:type II secretory pathway component GspD/PulD (secretin)